MRTRHRISCKKSSDGFLQTIEWGQNGDYPVANYNHTKRSILDHKPRAGIKSPGFFVGVLNVFFS